MRLEGVPFAEIEWGKIPREELPGEKGTARSRTYASKGIRVRMVEYSPGYVADHWCTKGHIVLCVRGEIVSTHKDGSTHQIRRGMAYVVGDNDAPHRSSSERGATLFIVD
jgi:hypothetical protein